MKVKVDNFLILGASRSVLRNIQTSNIYIFGFSQFLLYFSEMFMSEVCVLQRTGLEAQNIRKLLHFTLISPIMGHPV